MRQRDTDKSVDQVLSVYEGLVARGYEADIACVLTLAERVNSVSFTLHQLTDEVYRLRRAGGQV